MNDNVVREKKEMKKNYQERCKERGKDEEGGKQQIDEWKGRRT